VLSYLGKLMRGTWVFERSDEARSIILLQLGLHIRVVLCMTARRSVHLTM
jgi:hypothetical protein